MVRPHSPLRHASALTAAALLLAGCSVAGPGDGITGVTGSAAGTDDGGEPAAVPVPAHMATRVAGVESCGVLPQAPPDGTAANRLPPLRLPCLTPGPAIDLSALRGRPVLVNLWASWCGPCRDEMPLLQSSYERYGEDVQFLGVDTQDATEPAAEFLADAGVTYPQVVDVNGDLLGQLRIPGLPVTVVLDADGRIAGKHIGELTQSSINDLLDKVQ